MPSMTALETGGVSFDFAEFAKALARYRLARSAGFSERERVNILSAEWDLACLSEALANRAVGLPLDAIPGGAGAIRCATTQARAGIVALGDAASVITLATVLITLGSALASRNPSAVVVGLNAVQELLAHASKDPKIQERGIPPRRRLR